MRYVTVHPNCYRDSVNLMLLSSQLLALPGVQDAAILMGTPANRTRLQDLGYEDELLDDAGPNDLCVAVELAESALTVVQGKVDTFLSGRGGEGGGRRAGRPAPRTLRTALRAAPTAPIVSISVPGEYAATEAERALLANRHVFLFSDNVPLEEERRLKQLASGRGLLLMGPDCGTALISGVPLGFCNRVPRGPVGLVAASGTGAQEIMCQLAERGVGVSHVLGTGGRDLQEEIGGLSFLAAMAALERDPATRVLVLVSKPPSPAVEARILAAAAESTKPVVISFVGGREWSDLSESVVSAPSLADGAALAAALVRDADRPAPLSMEGVLERHGAILRAARADLQETQRSVRGLYSGGTLAAEATLVLRRWSDERPPGGARSSYAASGEGMPGTRHQVVDLGDDRFTSGRSHPMIDGTLRSQRLLEEAADPTVAVLLLDVVLGLNADPDPAAYLIPAMARARERAAEAGRALVAIASVCGTERDPQDRADQVKRLTHAGFLLLDSNVEAAYAAAFVAGAGQEPASEPGGRSYHG